MKRADERRRRYWKALDEDRMDIEALRHQIRERLGNIVTKKDSYDSVINMLIDQYNIQKE